MVLQEGVIPSLVSISVNGSPRGGDKSQKLLMMFREQRQREQPSLNKYETPRNIVSAPLPMSVPAQGSVQESDLKPFFKSISRTKTFTRPFSFLWKKRYSLHH
ncbi:U-box domain-containing protein 6 [Raphanus sativus]|nr:U-box domain-containing protein 6 [Raphanus sativus]